MNPEDLKKILNALSTADVREFSLKTGGYSLDLRRGPQAFSGPAFSSNTNNSLSAPTFETAPAPALAAPIAAPASTAAAPTASPTTTGASVTGASAVEAAPIPIAEAPAAKPAVKGAPVKAPIVGTFYASSSPDAPVYVKVGDTVAVGQVLCIIEAMKLMNEIEAEAGGIVREILVKNAEPVEYGQTLFIIE